MATSQTAGIASSFEHFGSKLYAHVGNSENGNVFLSPASVALAMSMCAVGAREITLEQMLKALEFKTKEDLVQTAEQVMAIFKAAENDSKVKLRLANRLYGQKNYKLQQPYLDIVRKSFVADVKLEDFENANEQAVANINAWVEEQTNKLIRDLLKSSDVPSDTRLILVNCIYFKGTWVDQFKKDATDNDADFYGASGVKSKVALMHQTTNYAYIDNQELKAQIAHLPYKSADTNLQFVLSVILPHTGVPLEDVEKRLTSDPTKINKILSNQGTSTEELSLYLPKFKMECAFSLKNAMIDLGMKNAFDSSAADFKDIVKPEDDPRRLVISDVIHKAFIEVNEEGSEAAAATAVIMVACMSFMTGPQPIEFKANRPFLFAIREAKQNVTLFMGKFTQSKQ